MVRKKWRMFLWLGLLLAPWVLAQEKTLFIKSKGVKLLENPQASSKVLEVLNQGEAVVWQGAASQDKQFHKIQTAKQKLGFVLLANLSPRPLADEYLGSAKGAKVDPKAFASSAAATKALTEAGLKYADGDISKEEVARQLITLEVIAQDVREASAKVPAPSKKTPKRGEK